MVDYRPQYTAIDNIERAYRARSQSNYQDSASSVSTTVDTPPPSSVGRSSYSGHSSSTGSTVDLPVATRPAYTEQIQFTGSTVSPPKPVPSYTKESKVVEETVEYPQHTHSVAQKSRMGYYDEDGKFYIKP